MKFRQTGFLLMLLVACVAGVAVYWFSMRLQHLPAADFLRQAESINRPSSMMWTGYGGVRDDKVFLEQQQKLRFPEEITYWTELDGLPQDVVDAILAGTGRWERATNP